MYHAVTHIAILFRQITPFMFIQSKILGEDASCLQFQVKEPFAIILQGTLPLRDYRYAMHTLNEWVIYTIYNTSVGHLYYIQN